MAGSTERRTAPRLARLMETARSEHHREGPRLRAVRLGARLLRAKEEPADRQVDQDDVRGLSSGRTRGRTDQMTNDTAFAEAQARIEARIEAATARALNRIERRTPTENREAFQDIARAISEHVAPAFDLFAERFNRVVNAVATIFGGPR